MPQVDLIHQGLIPSNLTRVQTALCIINKGIFDITQPVLACPVLFFWDTWNVDGFWTFALFWIFFLPEMIVLRWLKKNTII